MPEHDAGQRLDLEIAQGLLLLLREVAHLRLRELDVVEVALADLRYRALDLGGGELERRRRPVVEFLRQLAHRRVAPGLDLRRGCCSTVSRTLASAALIALASIPRLR